MSAVAVGALLLPTAPPRVWTVLAVCAAIPDLDAIGRPFAHGDIALLGGHRALTHSLSAAAVLGIAATTVILRSAPSPLWPRVWAALFLAIASHGLLDACTSYGQGIALFAPWTWQRFRLPWTPLGGFASDTALFLLAAVVARSVIRQRGWPQPRWLALRSSAPVA